MDLRTALKEQYHAGLAMLQQCVERCPNDLWSASRPTTDEERQIDRACWRIAFHAAYFTHLYMGQNEASVQPWPDPRPDTKEMWGPPWSLEPYEMPVDTAPYSQDEILDYIDFIDKLVDSTVEGLDLETEDPGFCWYKRISKLSHELMNLRHIQGHIGQLSELLMERGIDIDWIARR